MYSKFTISHLGTGPVIRSYSKDDVVKGFVIELTGDTIMDNITRILEYVYDNIDGFRGGYMKVKRGDYYGYIDLKLEEVVKPIYDSAEQVKECFACVKKDNKYGYLKMEDGCKPYMWTEIEFEKAFSFSNGMGCVIKDGLFGYISNSFETKYAIPYKYEDAYDFNEEGYAVVGINGKYGMINKNGEFILQPVFDEYYDTYSYGNNYNASIGNKHYWLHSDGTYEEAQ